MIKNHPSADNRTDLPRRPEEAMQESEERFRALVRAAPVGIFFTDGQGDCLFVNPRWCDLAGLTPEEAQGKGWFQALHPEDREEVAEAWHRAAQAGHEFNMEYRFLTPRGKVSWLWGSAAPVRNDQGAITGYLGTVVDISSRRLVEEIFMTQARVLESMAEGVSMTDPQGVIFFTNPAFDAMFGYGSGDLLGRHVSTLNDYSPQEHARIMKDILKLVRSQGTWRGEFRNRKKDGTCFYTYASISGLEITGKRCLVTVQEDITQRKRMQEELRALSMTDPLTGLYNRREFFTLAEQQIKAARRKNKGMLLLFADVDRMKWINDTLGHQEGDQALREAADVLRKTFRDSDILARMGGDEFVVLMPDIENLAAEAEVVAVRLTKNLRTCNAGRQRPYHLDLSIGIASFDPHHPCSVEELLSRGDALMYEQKKNKAGGNRLDNGHTP